MEKCIPHIIRNFLIQTPKAGQAGAVTKLPSIETLVNVGPGGSTIAPAKTHSGPTAGYGQTCLFCKPPAAAKI